MDRRGRLVCLILLGCFVAGCRAPSEEATAKTAPSESPSSTPAVSAPPAVPPMKPAFEPFVQPAYKPPASDSVFQFPVQTLTPWYVMMLQDRPIPKKTPAWVKAEPTRSGLLEMPPGSRFRCLYNPVLVRGTADREGEQLAGWVVLRTVRCSSDGWLTYSQAVLSVTVDPSGKKLAQSGEQAELYLHDQIDGQNVEMTLILRAEEPHVPKPFYPKDPSYGKKPPPPAPSDNVKKKRPPGDEAPQP